MWNDVIRLISVTTIVNDIGDAIEAETENEVYANKKSIKQSEYYQALSAGLKPEITFQVHSWEYVGEKKLICDEKTYRIIRTYEKGDFIELVCEAVI